ncbi:hypothetical protein J437_LFUL015300 [Ladona fulva]|uniref:Uncharacterized protein n=1 Tax=Ladona fulva TaxID=123851 RepID=A0A8K0P636_LADFU|nr:hypothetical protein J437_LFUL015300 [Ladona fulva]
MLRPTYIRGSPENLLYPTDSFGKRCGVDEGVRDKPFLLFFDLTRCAQPALIHTGCPTPQICVEECPAEDFSSFIYIENLGMWDKAKVQKQLVCTYGYDKSRVNNPNDLKDAVIKKECAPWYLKSQSILLLLNTYLEGGGTNEA